MDCHSTGEVVVVRILFEMPTRPQVKEGTENRGAIESVVRVIRKVVSNDLTSKNANY